MKKIAVSINNQILLLFCWLFLSFFYTGFSIAANPNIKFEKRQLAGNKTKVYLNYTYDKGDVIFKGEEGEIPLLCSAVLKEEPIEYARYYLGRKEYDRLRKIFGPNLDNLAFSYIVPVRKPLNNLAHRILARFFWTQCKPLMNSCTFFA